VLQGILGYSEARYNDLEQAGIIGDRPLNPRTPSRMGMDERVKQGRLAYYDTNFKEKLGI
jgi:hypothetical protein